MTSSLIFDLSFSHNLCYRCPNDSCEVILDIYTSRPFQRYKEHLKARCFDPCNRTLNFRESQRTFKSHFRECEWRPHTSLKVGLRQPPTLEQKKNHDDKESNSSSSCPWGLVTLEQKMHDDKELRSSSSLPLGPPTLEQKKTRRQGAKLFVVVFLGCTTLEQKNAQ